VIKRLFFFNVPVAMLLGDTARADMTTGGPLKVGGWYFVSASKDTPLICYADNLHRAFEWANVQVLKNGPDHWCWVEFDEVPNAAQANTGSITIVKNREWLNLALVSIAVPQPPPNYNSLYPRGYTVVPYSDQ
jgi:hypothetical protein